MMRTRHALLVASAAASLLAFPPAALAVTRIVNQVGTTFSPSSLSVHPGDVVEWHWSSLSHTVTSGTGPTDPIVGTLFDQALTASNPIVSHTFTTDGDFPYFCRIHFDFGMTGVIHVVSTVPLDQTTWGLVKSLYE